MTDLFEVDLPACRTRQQRLVDQMRKFKVGLTVLSRRESVQWLTGAYVGPLFPVIAAISSEGEASLVLPARKADLLAAADHQHSYQEKQLSTMRDAHQMQAACVTALFDHLPGFTGKAACEFSAASLHLTKSWPDDWMDFDQVMFSLRRRKDPDELRMMRRANDANRVMYQHARNTIAPGTNELDLYNSLHAAAVRELGEPLTYFGQDFRCCARGGAPRDRECQPGELHILDLGVGFRGYYSDNARTISVGGDPSESQQTAWRRLAEVFPHVESTARPGGSCKALFEQVEQMLADLSPWAFNHHLGHGVGLAPHEGPHLNPNWDDTFQPGDFFTVEPGLYHEELRAGIRLEQNYVVTDTGVELLTDWPLEL